MHYIIIVAYEFTHSFIYVAMVSFNCSGHSQNFPDIINMTSLKVRETSYTTGEEVGRFKKKFSSSVGNGRKLSLICKKKMYKYKRTI